MNIKKQARLHIVSKLGSDINTLADQEVLDIMRQCIGLQLFCDWGYVQGRGATAFVITAIIDSGGKIENKIIGAHGRLLSIVYSAFHTEVTALDMAISYFANIAQLS